MTATATERPAKGSAPIRRGSDFSDKQIAQSVKDGKAIEVTIRIDEEPIFGWVYGADDFHWGVVNQWGETYLVHKSVPCIKVTTQELDRQAEHIRSAVEPLVTPFRAYVMRTFFNQTATA